MSINTMHRISLGLLAGLMLTACGLQTAPSTPPAALVADALPQDPAVIHGTLDNGLNYYLRRNDYPEKRVSLRLVVQAGSLMENDRERGLAHFVEHMAFNGTRHYPKNALVSELENMGMQFGSHLNAFTSYTETVYQLTVPTDNPENLGKALTILRDWADGIEFPEAEVIKERGVVLEEWRRSKGVGERLQDQILPALYAGSRYVDRKPIGDPAIITSATPEQLRRFYHHWYVPARMAVIAVGDIDPAQLGTIVSAQFGDIQARRSPKAPNDQLTPQPGLRHVEVVDPENPVTTAELAFVHREPPLVTARDYRHVLTRELAMSILNERLEDTAQSPGSAMLDAGISVSPLDRVHSLYTVVARTTAPAVLPTFSALEKELARITRLGVTRDELARQKADYLASLDQAVQDEQRIASDNYVEAYIDNFLTGDPYLTVGEEHRQSQAALPLITPEDVRAVLNDLFGPDRLAVVSGTSGTAYPTPAAVAQTLRQAEAATPRALDDVDHRTALIEHLPTPGKLVEEHAQASLGTTELRYANGVRVLLKPTRFQNTQILMQAFSPGGLSVVSDADFRDAAVSADLVAQSGYGRWSFSELKKLTAGQLFSLSPYIGDIEEGLSGSARPEDLEPMLQLTHLAFTAPRIEPGVFASLSGRLRDYTSKRLVNGEQRFDEAVRSKYTQDAPRYRPWTPDMVDALDSQHALELYRRRFADAGDFQFVFVGNFQVDAIKPLLARYLGSLPDHGRRERPQDTGTRPLPGQHRLSLAEGSEPRTQVRLLLSAPGTWSREELYLLSSLKQVIDSRLRQEIRENLSGVYDIGINGELNPFPEPIFEGQVAFVCAPERADELVAAVKRVLAQVREQGVTQAEVDRVLAAQRQDYQARQRDNGAWLQALKFSRSVGWDPEGSFLLDFPQRAKSLTPDALRRVAKRYLGLENLLVAELTPAPGIGSPKGAASPAR